MGNKNHVTSKEEDLISEHTQLNNAKIISVDGQQVLRCSVCLDRKDYNRWKGSLQPYQDSSKILMPRSHRFISTTLCGSAGTVEVAFALSRSTIQTFHTCSIQKSRIDYITPTTSVSLNFGTCSWRCSVPKSRQRKGENSWEMCVLEIFC